MHALLNAQRQLYFSKDTRQNDMQTSRYEDTHTPTLRKRCNYHGKHFHTRCFK